MPLNPRTQKWVDTLQPKVNKRLSDWGVLDVYQAPDKQDIQDLVYEWGQTLTDKGRPDSYMLKRVNSTLKVLNEAEITQINRLTVDIVQRALAKHRGNMADNTIAGWASAIKGFSNWLYTTNRTNHHQLAGLKVQRTSHVHRRALTEDEQLALIEATVHSQEVVFGQPPQARCLIYQVALTTGARASAIGRLKVKDVNFEHQALILRPNSDNKRASPKPMHDDLVEPLKQFIDGKDQDGLLFPDWPKNYNLARMTRHDAAAAHLKDAGSVQFKDLRTSFATTLARRGVHPKTLQALMDHSSIEMTMTYYAVSFPEDQARAVNEVLQMKRDQELPTQRLG